MKLRVQCQQSGLTRRPDGHKLVILWDTYIVLGQEVERAEDFVIVKLEAFGSLEDALVVCIRRYLQDLLGTPLRLELSLRVLR
jgi:hypothetical protein